MTAGVDAGDNAWQDFLAAGVTLVNRRDDFFAWHQGRPRYCLWALELEGGTTAMSAAQSHLASHLLEGYCRQPHITLSLCGFPAARPGATDEFGEREFIGWERALVSAGLGCFQVAFGGLRSFSSAPYFSVVDCEGGIKRLRAALAGSEGGDRVGAYVPHVTVGLYGAAWPVAEVARHLVAFSGPMPEPCRVERVSLLSYEAAVIGGPLRREASFDLATRQLDGVPPWPSR